MKLVYVLFVVWWIHRIDEIRSQILIPEELPSILSVFYSNVPPIKKGTDSRVGVGFRLGQNADFQVQFEIGPQLNTQPIGPNVSKSNIVTDTSSSTSTNIDTVNAAQKRQSNVLSVSSTTLAPVSLNYSTSSNLGQIWLNVWKMNVTGTQNAVDVANFPKTVLDTTTISQIVVDPAKKKNNLFVNQLRKLYVSMPRTTTTTTDAIDGDNLIESINNNIYSRR